MPETPTSCSASFTSSSLNGLMIASIFFTVSPEAHEACLSARLARFVPEAGLGSSSRLHVPHRFNRCLSNGQHAMWCRIWGQRRKALRNCNKSRRSVRGTVSVRSRCAGERTGVRCMQPMPMDLPAELHRRASNLPDGDDRKSTRLNSSHVRISYAVFCLKKKKQTTKNTTSNKHHMKFHKTSL